MPNMKPNVIYDSKYEAIISRLVQARKAENLTQKEMAEKLNLTQDKVSRVERCQRQLGVLELLQWIEAANLIEWKPIVQTMTEAKNG